MDEYTNEGVVIPASGYTAHVWCASAWFLATAHIYPLPPSGWL